MMVRTIPSPAKPVERPKQHKVEFAFCSVVEQRRELLALVGAFPAAFVLDVLLSNGMTGIRAPSP
jgi:hypothetical protein